MIELVRLRVAFHNQCRSCMAIRYPDALADGLTEDLVCSLEKPMEADDLTDAEKLAIRYGELFATNHLAIGDDFYDQLREHFTEAQIVELGLNVALFVGVGRLSATWDMIEELPDRFQDDGTVVPVGRRRCRRPLVEHRGRSPGARSPSSPAAPAASAGPWPSASRPRA